MISKQMLNNKTVFISGGTGSFGQQFIDQVVKNFKPKKLIVFSRDELKQFEMKKKFSDKELKNIRFFIGDIRDKERVSQALREVDVVVHAAALKQVDTAEYNPLETIKTNIGGAENLILACLQNNVQKVLALSTDKASSPINLYGATKLASDKLFINANNITGGRRTIFSVLRYGNVMSSRGSVIPLFQKLCKEKKTITITDKSMTRFSLTLNDSVNFSFLSLKQMIGGEIFVPKVSSYRILDLYKAICPNSKIKFVGKRPGEKMHEELVSNIDALNTIDTKNFYIITPHQTISTWNKKNFTKHNNLKKIEYCKKNFSYTSDNNQSFLSVKTLRKIISKLKI
jgi:UDP-N-acetylglucosamine 4,6-dehydratase (inverting)